MTYSDVQAMLEDAVSHETIHAHGNFWRGKTRDEFVGMVVLKKWPLLVVGNAKESNLIKAVRGLPPFDGTEASQMPDGFPPLSEASIAKLEGWIDAGCPV